MQGPPFSAPVLTDVDPAELGRVTDVMRAFEKAMRAHQLYEGASPAYDRFVEILRGAFAALWQHADSLALEVQETRLAWRGQTVLEGHHRPGDLAFLFYRDGIRELEFLPGFEQREMEALLSLIGRAHRTRADEDDLITLMWAQDLSHVRYRSVDVMVDEAGSVARDPAPARPIDPGLVRAEVAQSQGQQSRSVFVSAAADSMLAPVADLDGGSVALEPAELEQIREETRREFARDLTRDVLHALLDRFQDGSPQRQVRVVGVLATLLPVLISGGRFRLATLVLQELKQAAANPSSLDPSVRDVVGRLFAQLAEPDTVREMTRTFEDAPSAVRIEECAAMLRYFPPAALEPLLVAAETMTSADLQQTLLSVAEHLAGDDPFRVLPLLGAASPEVAAGAARLAGRLGITAATAALGRLLTRREPAVRLASVAALQAIGGPSSADALLNVLDDPEREVRMAAARALGESRHSGARARLESLIQSKQVRDADLTERIAYFEAYGAVAGANGIELLNRILNGRTWLGRREPADVRASAALALGRIDDPEARRILSEAATDSEAVVRNAVARGRRRQAG